MAQGLQDWMAVWRRRIDAVLEAYLLRETETPAHLLQAMSYSLLAPGKRLRPLLALLATEAAGGEIEDALPAACAVEMIHTYSLVHDDLPGMDDDDLRRGRPTCHVQFGEATAILVGDGLQALAFQVIAEEVQPETLAALCCAELARSVGVAGMVGGQMDDLGWEKRDGAKLADLQSIHQRKTAALFRAACRLGGMIGLDSSPSEGQKWRGANVLAALSSFGEHLGHAFQIADDLLDVKGDEVHAGKRVGKDAARGKLTYPGLIGVDGSRQELQRFIDAAITDLTPLGDAGEKLRQVAGQLAKPSK